MTISVQVHFLQSVDTYICRPRIYNLYKNSSGINLNNHQHLSRTVTRLLYRKRNAFVRSHWYYADNRDYVETLFAPYYVQIVAKHLMLQTRNVEARFLPNPCLLLAGNTGSGGRSGKLSVSSCPVPRWLIEALCPGVQFLTYHTPKDCVPTCIRSLPCLHHSGLIAFRRRISLSD